MARKRKLIITAEISPMLQWPQLRVMGIDPSLSSTGWSVVNFFPLTRPRLLGYGTVHTGAPIEGKTNMKNIVERSRIVVEQMRGVVDAWPVDVVVIELPIPARGGVGSGHVGPTSQSGSMIVTAVYNAMPYSSHDIELMDLHHIKKLVANTGTADKQQVKAAVAQWLGTLPRTNTDVSDSIAASIAFALEHLTEAPTD